MHAFNAERMGHNNRLTLLNMVRHHPGISRRELAVASGLDPSTVTKVISLFLDQGLVEETGEKKSSGAGRRSVCLAVRHTGGVAVAVKVGVERTAMARGYLDNSYEVWAEFPTPSDPAEFFDTVAREIQGARTALPPGQRLVAYSFALPGMVDAETGLGVSFPHLGWRNIDFQQEIFRRLPDRRGLLLLGNEAQLSLTAEALRHPELAAAEGGIYIYLAHGVGGGILLRGSVYRGASNCAGELGHMVVDPTGPLCHCGHRGCFETFVSINSLVRNYEARAVVPLEGTDVPQKYREILRRRDEGNETAREVLHQMEDHLVQGLGNVCNVLNPEFVMLGGMGAEFSDALLEEIQEMLRCQVLELAAKKLRVVRASIGIDDSALLGATLVAMDCYARTTVG